MRGREIARELPRVSGDRKTNTEQEEWAGFGHQFSVRTRVGFESGFWVSGGGAGMGGTERCERDMPELRCGETQLELHRKHLDLGVCSSRR